MYKDEEWNEDALLLDQELSSASGHENTNTVPEEEDN